MAKEFNQFIRETPFDIQLPTIALGKQLRIEGQPTLAVFPNNDKRTYSRAERLEFSIQAIGGIPIGIAEVGGGLKNTITGEFVRQYPSQAAAVTDIRFNVQNVPISAKRALTMEPMDYYRTKMRMVFSVAAGFAARSGVLVGAVGAEYLLAGDFQLEVFRLEGSRVFVRASSLREHTRGVKALLGMNADLRLFELDPLNNGLNNFVNVQIAEVDFIKKSKGKLFTIEFTYNLADPQSANAYNQLMNPATWEVKDLLVLNPLRKTSVVERVLRSKIYPSEVLSRLDQDRSNSDARVRRTSKSDTFYESDGSGIEFDIRLVKFSQSNSFLRQDFSYITGPKEEKYNNYRIGTVNSQSGFKWGLGYDGRDLYSEANAIFELNDHKQLVDFKELYFKVERDDRRLQQDEINDVQGLIHKMLPEEYHSQANIVPFLRHYLGRGSFIRIELTLSRNSLTSANRLDAVQIANVVTDFVDSTIDREIDDRHEDYYGELKYLDVEGQNDRPRKFAIEDKVQFDLNRINERLPMVLQRSPSLAANQAKWDQMVRLIRIPLFHELGSGLFTRILREAAGDQGFQQNIYFKVTARGRGHGEKNQKIYEIGNYQNAKLSAELLPLRNRIMNRDDFTLEYFQDAAE